MNEKGAFESFIRQTVKCLDELKVDYCIVGAIAASYYGSVCSTEDLDIIINVTAHEDNQVQQMASCLQTREIDLLEQEMLKGLAEESHITAFDTRTYFYRIDFKGVYSQLDVETMNNKQQVTILDNLTVWLTIPELQIIAKLMPGMKSEKDILDVKNILSTFKESLNIELLNHFAQKFNVEQELMVLL